MASNGLRIKLATHRNSDNNRLLSQLKCAKGCTFVKSGANNLINSVGLLLLLPKLLAIFCLVYICITSLIVMTWISLLVSFIDVVYVYVLHYFIYCKLLNFFANASSLYFNALLKNNVDKRIP